MSLLFAILRAPFRFVYGHPWWSIFLATVGFFVSTVGAYKFVEYRSYCDLAAAIAETDAASPRWRIEELEADRAVIPDAENSAIVIAKVEALRKQAELNTPPEVLLDNILERLFVGRPPQRRLSDTKLTELRLALQAVQPALDEAAKLTTLPRGRWPIKFEPDGSTPLPHHTPVRAVAWLLLTQVILDSHKANSRRVVDCLIGMIHTGRSLADEPIDSSLFETFAMQRIVNSALGSSLAISTLNDEDLRRLEGAVSEEMTEWENTSLMRSERALCHTFFDDLEQGDSANLLAILSDARQRSARPAIEAMTDSLYRPLVPADHAFALRMMNRACLIATQPSETQSQAFDKWKQDIAKSVVRGPLNNRNVIAGSFLRFAVRHAQYNTLALAKLRVLQTAIATERFRLTYGRWPADVAELVPEFLPDTPRDPFDGEPLRMQLRKESLSVYSLDVNVEDDGGIEGDAYGKGDITFQLFNPDQRGLPALPEKSPETAPPSENNDP